MIRRLTILGATGSIGDSTMSLIRDKQSQGANYQIVSLVGGRNVEKLIALAKEFRPQFCVIADEDHYDTLQSALSPLGLPCGAGTNAVIEAASLDTDWTMAAIVGIAGLAPVWAAAAHTKVLSLANKESLVCGGKAILRRLKDHNVKLLPVDSEHNALFQALDSQQKKSVSRLILTASGGPFLGRSHQDLAHVTTQQALLHPNWTMGAKVTIDSATLANKGLEWIEAAHMFNDTLQVSNAKIEVVIHPQSIIHSMVEYKDGSVLAQLGSADMRIPISYCLNHPERMDWQAPRLDFIKLNALTFKSVDHEAFPMLSLAIEAYEHSAMMPIVYNAANEMAVEAFLAGRLGFNEIATSVKMAMKMAQLPTNSKYKGDEIGFSEIFELDQWTRDLIKNQHDLVLETR
jgi:1-deoxy-D-xylulose-5-phosphate reductoisomerase